jgi:hypothetical protein
VVLEERGDARGSFRRRFDEERGTGLRGAGLCVFRCMNMILSRRSKEERTYAGVELFMITRRNFGLHAQTLGAALNSGAQVDARGATQILDRGGQAVAPGSCLLLVLDRGAQAVARGAVPCSPQGTWSWCRGRCTRGTSSW